MATNAAEARSAHDETPPTSDASASDTPTSNTETPKLQVLTRPAEGIPPVTDTDPALDQVIRTIRAGHGPIALDTERAQGFRYSARAYLVQLRREGSGSHLVDASAFLDAERRPHLEALQQAMAEPEWILHAADQDLPCLTEAGLHPRRVFDTELAARLLGLPHVGLGALIEQFFGIHLLKEHSAADWSRRPLPEDWLAYAALDVELLIPLRERMVAMLEEAGRTEWARQEFAAVVADAGKPAHQRRDRWRRTTGTHDVKTRRGLAVVRELWTERDQVAQRIDRGPGRVLADVAITALARLADTHDTLTRDSLRSIEGFRHRTARRFEQNWWQAAERAMALPADELPPKRLPPDGPPSPRTWERQRPWAAARWTVLRPAANEAADELHLSPEYLVSPASLRHLCWDTPEHQALDAEYVASALTDLGARPWQVEILAPAFAEASTTTPEQEEQE